MQYKGIVIFDLDGTTIDSSHRQLTNKNGFLDLSHWKENSTREKILKDSPLALSELWKNLSKDFIKVVCTARVMSEHDVELLKQHGLKADYILSRPENDRGTPDDLLKVAQLHWFLDRQEHRDIPVIMFDDSATVRSTLRRLGFPVVHPKKVKGYA